MARAKEEAEAAKKIADREELQRMKEYQLKLKLARIAEEKEMENEFK